MALFGGKHYSNPAVGRAHEGAGQKESGGMKPMPPMSTSGGGGGSGHSAHAYFHSDGSAHTHIHRADGSHEHTDHATHNEAADHIKNALDGGGGDQGPELGDWAQEEKQEPQHMTVHGATRAGGGAF